MTTYFSKTLRNNFPAIAEALENHTSCQELDSSNLWARDYMPVKIGKDYVKFKYGRSHKYPQLDVNSDAWLWLNPFMSDIYLDGGNVVQDDKTVFMTDIAFKNNKGMTNGDVTQFLKDQFHKNLIFLPVEPGDDLGHTDGIVRFIDEKTVFINDYRNLISQTWLEYAMKLERILSENGFTFIRLPWAYGQCPQLSEAKFRKMYPYADDYNPGYGYYINYFQTETHLFMPTFELADMDWECNYVLHKYFPDHQIIPVDCSHLSMLGGLLNCVTWEK